LNMKLFALPVVYSSYLRTNFVDTLELSSKFNQKVPIETIFNLGTD
jgi:hypothetical protein